MTHAEWEKLNGQLMILSQLGKYIEINPYEEYSRGKIVGALGKLKSHIISIEPFGIEVGQQYTSKMTIHCRDNLGTSFYVWKNKEVEILDIEDNLIYFRGSYGDGYGACSMTIEQFQALFMKSGLNI